MMRCLQALSSTNYHALCIVAHLLVSGTIKLVTSQCESKYVNPEDPTKGYCPNSCRTPAGKSVGTCRLVSGQNVCDCPGELNNFVKDIGLFGCEEDAAKCESAELCMGNQQAYNCHVTNYFARGPTDSDFCACAKKGALTCSYVDNYDFGERPVAKGDCEGVCSGKSGCVPAVREEYGEFDYCTCDDQIGGEIGILEVDDKGKKVSYYREYVCIPVDEQTSVATCGKLEPPLKPYNCTIVAILLDEEDGSFVRPAFVFQRGANVCAKDGAPKESKIYGEERDRGNRKNNHKRPADKGNNGKRPPTPSLALFPRILSELLSGLRSVKKRA